MFHRALVHLTVHLCTIATGFTAFSQNTYITVRPHIFTTSSILSNINEQFTVEKLTEIQPNDNILHDGKGETKKECISTIKFELYDNTTPFTSQKFQQLASGISGFGYKGTQFHRVIPNCIIQGGIITLTDENRDLQLYEQSFPGQFHVHLVVHLWSHIRVGYSNKNQKSVFAKYHKIS
jgi:hypothetical protein